MKYKLIDIIHEIDNNLKLLGQSDSSIEYAEYIREHFDGIVNGFNDLKRDLGLTYLQRNSNKYFE